MNQTFVMLNPNRMNYIDPRIKILHAFIAGWMLFIVRANAAVLFNVAFIIAILVFFGLRHCAVKLALYTAVLYGLIFFLNFVGGSVATVIGVTVYIFFKFSPVLGIYFIMTKSISASELVNALEKLGLPRSITITLAVTLRFMPTIGYEIKIIKDSMKIRNIPLNLWNVIKSPVTMMEFVIVPLMMRFVKVAEELAAAAVVRGIERPGQRGSIFEIKLQLRDFIYLFLVIIFSACIYCYERGGVI